MRATVCPLVVLLAVSLSPSVVRAQCCWAPIPQLQTASGFYRTNECGMVYGPMYCLRPAHPPFQGMIPAPKQPCPQYIRLVTLANGQVATVPCAPTNPGAVPGPPPSPTFPNHPFARSPRDFFMVD
jgi:hypothetical protein